MTITEKIAKNKDKTIFTLYREGLFYKCYNEDAMVFAQKVKAYKVSSKYVKSVGAEVLSLGFPASEVEKGNLSLELIKSSINAYSYKEEVKSIVFYIRENIKNNYLKYKEALVSSKEHAIAEKQLNYGNTDSKVVIKMIQEFDLANSTPMQGLIFIQELKNHIQTQA